MGRWLGRTGQRESPQVRLRIRLKLFRRSPLTRPTAAFAEATNDMRRAATRRRQSGLRGGV